jgi:hypothetical protein
MPRLDCPGVDGDIQVVVLEGDAGLPYHELGEKEWLQLILHLLHNSNQVTPGNILKMNTL